MLYVDDPIPALRRQLAGEILALPGEPDRFALARVLGFDEPRINDLQRGRLDRFSLQRLIRALANVNRRVVLHVEVDGPAAINWFALLRERGRLRREREAAMRGAPPVVDRG